MKFWEKVKLNHLLKESKIISTSPDITKRIRVRLNVGGIDRRPEGSEKMGATKYYIRKAGQFIYGKQNLHKGAFGIIPAELDGYESSQDLPAFDVHESCYPEWIYYFFRQDNFYLKLESLARGVGSKRIQPKDLFQLTILLPPKEEQRKILEIVKDVESNHMLLLKEFDKQVALFEKLKLSILNEALSGKLTEDWRNINGSQGDASELLKQIRLIRKNISRHKEKKIDKIQKKSTGFVPQGWVSCKFGDYAYCERGRFSARPRNDPKYYHGTIPFIQIGDLPSDGGTITSHNQTLNDQGLKVSKLFPKGTVVIAIVGGTIGNTGILGYEMCFPDSLVGIKPTSLTDFKFIEFFLRSKKEYFRNQAYAGGGQPNIKLPTINDCPLLLPPLVEQQIIVSKIESLNQYSEKLINTLNQQKQFLSSYMPAFLNAIWKNSNSLSSYELTPKIENMKTTFEKLLNTLNAYEKADNDPLELKALLEKHGRMSAVSLWQMSKFNENIDAFYEELKKLVDEQRIIKESHEKGYLELV